MLAKACSESVITGMSLYGQGTWVDDAGLALGLAVMLLFLCLAAVSAGFCDSAAAAAGALRLGAMSLCSRSPCDSRSCRNSVSEAL